MTVEITPAMSREEFDGLFGSIIAIVDPWKLQSVADHMQDVARNYRKGGRKPRNRKQRQPKVSKQNRRKEYEAYMKSSVWQAIRKKVLDRDSHKCLCCGNPACEVHHRSYSAEVLEGRDNSKLASMCGRCHNHIHYDDDNQKRSKGATEKVYRGLVCSYATRMLRTSSRVN